MAGSDEPRLDASRRGANARRAVLAIGLLAAIASGVWLVRRPSDPVDRSPTPADRSGGPQSGAKSSGPAYVGTAACVSCHEAEAESHRQTMHARALVEVDPAGEPPDVTFDHSPSQRRYRVDRVAGEMVHHETLLVEGEHALHTYPVRYRMGSGHFGRGYFCELDGFLIESPVSWFEPRKSWGMSPGYDTPNHESFARSVSTACLGCHSGRVDIDDGNEFRPRIVELGIGCERCHGPGEQHVAHHAPDQHGGTVPADSIVNPRHLPRKLSEDVCNQCHLQGDVSVPGLGKRESDFRPGVPLADFRNEYRIVSQESGMRVAGHSEQLHLSRCYQKSESLTCLSCHPPHRLLPEGGRVDHYRRICLECHTNRGCLLPAEARQERAGDDCTKCHMPASGTEVPHVAFTHHRIGRHEEITPTAGKRTVPRLAPLQDLTERPEEEQQRSLGLACLEMHRRAASRTAGRTPFQDQAYELLHGLSPELRDEAVEAGLAELELRLGLLDRAEERASRLVNDDGIEPTAGVRSTVRNVLAELALQRQDFETARTHFRELTRLRFNARDHFYLGFCEDQCGDAEAAVLSLQNSLRIEPVQEGSGDVLAGILERLGRADEAEVIRRRSQLVRRVIRSAK